MRRINDPWAIRENSTVFQIGENNQMKTVSDNIKQAIIELAIELKHPPREIMYEEGGSHDAKGEEESYTDFIKRSGIGQNGDYLVSTRSGERYKGATSQNTVEEQIIIIALDKLNEVASSKISEKEKQIANLELLQK